VEIRGLGPRSRNRILPIVTQDELDQMMRDAQPSWAKDGLGVRGVPQTSLAEVAKFDAPDFSPTPPVAATPSFNNTVTLEQDPIVEEEVQQATPIDLPPVEFQLISTQNEGAKVVEVAEGKVNGLFFPDGMGVSPLYIQPSDGNIVWLCVPIDTASLTLDDSSSDFAIGFGSELPDPDTESTPETAKFYLSLGTVSISSGQPYTIDNQHWTGPVTVNPTYRVINGALFIHAGSNAPLADQKLKEEA